MVNSCWDFTKDNIAYVGGAPIVFVAFRQGTCIDNEAAFSYAHHLQL